MSHFIVMVVSETDERSELEKILQPWHQYECTGTKDQYVEFVPPHESDEELENTFQEVKGEYKYENRIQYMEDYYGYEQNKKGDWGRWTNPNAKWDWWSVGGRWTGSLKLKETILIEDKNSVPDLCGFSVNEIQEIIKQIQKGNDKILNNFIGKRVELRKAIFYYTQKAYQKGIYGNYTGVHNEANLRDGRITKEEVQPIGKCDQAQKKYIDMNGMNQELMGAANVEYTKFHSRIIKREADFVLAVWKERQEKKDYNIGKDEVHKILKKASGNDPFKFIFGDRFKNLATMTKEEYIECAGTWSPYALVYNGKWYANGDMRWFGISLNEELQWAGIFQELWKEIPEDSFITMVDCHI